MLHFWRKLHAGKHRLVATPRWLATQLLNKHGTASATAVCALLQFAEQVRTDAPPPLDLCDTCSLRSSQCQIEACVAVIRVTPSMLHAIDRVCGELPLSWLHHGVSAETAQQYRLKLC